MVGDSGRSAAATLSLLSIGVWQFPRLVYRHVFHQPLRKYFLAYGQYVLLTAAGYALTYPLCSRSWFASPLADLFLWGAFPSSFPGALHSRPVQDGALPGTVDSRAQAGMQMKRIFIAIQYMELGGAERALLGLLEALDTSRFRVDLFVYRHSGDLMPADSGKVNLLPELRLTGRCPGP